MFLLELDNSKFVDIYYCYIIFICGWYYFNFSFDWQALGTVQQDANQAVANTAEYETKMLE